MGMHCKTPTLSVNDPRGLPVRTVDYWRGEPGCSAQSRVNRTRHDAAGRAAEQWDPRLWALLVSDPLTRPNLATVYSLSAQVLRSDSVDAGMQIALHGVGSQVLLVCDSRGTRREVQHDLLLRPVAVFEEGISQPRRCVERLAYGRPGAGDPTRNQLGQLIHHDDPAGRVLMESFAISGQCIENTRHFTLDPDTPDWPERLQERTGMLEPGEGATSRWRFAPLGQALEKVDARGNRHGIDLTLDGRLRACCLQLKDQPEAQTLVSDIHYNADGLVAQELAGNGVLTTLTYRPEDGRLQTRQAGKSGGELLQHLIYDYDAMGNVLSIEDKALPIRYFANQRIDPVSRFSYDSLSQVIEATGWEAGGPGRGPKVDRRADPAAVINYRQTYCYDAGRNLLQLRHVGGQSPGHDLRAARYSNRCLSWREGVPPSEAEIAAAFDARGNVLHSEGGKYLQWNLRNQLSSVTLVARQSRLDDCESHSYNAAGLRARKVHQWQTNARTVVAQTRYLPGLELRSHSGRDEWLQVITVKSALNSVQVLHWESSARAEANDRYSYELTDHLGSINLRLDGTGQLLSREVFYPFGATAFLSGDVSDKTTGYLGKEQDASGLYYFGFRYYAARLQRWINPDPGEDVDGLNRYWAMRNNPLFYLDKDGQVAEPGQPMGSRGSPAAGGIGTLPSLSAETRGKVLEGAQVVGKTLSYSKNPLIGAVGSVLEAGARMVEIHDAQTQMHSRQSTYNNPVLSRSALSGESSALIGLRTETVGVTRFDNRWADTVEPTHTLLSPFALQMLQAGFGSAVPDSTSMAVRVEEPHATVHKRNKRGAFAWVSA